MVSAAALSRQRGQTSERFQEIDGGTEQRGGAIVGIGRAPRDQRGVRAGLRQRNRGRKAGGSTADDRDVIKDRSIVHPSHLTFPGGIFKPTVIVLRGRRPQTAHVQIKPIPDSTAPTMEQAEPSSTPLAPSSRRAAAFGVHLFTALGAGVALLALLEAVREHWSAMFAWLGVALVIDAADGPMARRLDVVRLQPNWSGDVLDLVVDFVTYVFVPAYAITASRLLLPVAAPLLGIGVAVSGALYFADRRMKSDDNHFRGFPGLWNVAAFYLFLLHWPPALSSLAIALLIVATFLPFWVLHPVRVVRLRWLTLTLMAVWGALTIYTLVRDFDVEMPVTVALCAIAVYVVASDGAFVAAEPSHRVVRTDHAGDAPADLFEHEVADGMAVGVVDRLEVVEIDVEKHEVAVRPVRRGGERTRRDWPTR